MITDNSNYNSNISTRESGKSQGNTCSLLKIMDFVVRKLEKVKHGEELLLNFDRNTIKRVLTNCVTVCYATCRADLHLVVKTAQCVVGMELPHLDSMYAN